MFVKLKIRPTENCSYLFQMKVQIIAPAKRWCDLCLEIDCKKRSCTWIGMFVKSKDKPRNQY